MSEEERDSMNAMPKELRMAIDQLDSFVADLQEHGALGHKGVHALAQHLAALLEMVSSGLGECREAVPYSAIRPVFRPSGGFEWCCNHDPEHCREG